MKLLKAILFISILSILIGCSVADDERVVDEPVESIFKLPVLSNFPLDGDLVDVTKQLQSRSYPYSFTAYLNDTLVFNDTLDYHKFNKNYDDKNHSFTNDVKLYVDDKQSFAGNYWEEYPYESLLMKLDENGNEIRVKPYTPPYKKVLKIPAFIYNPTDSIQSIVHHDGRMIFIQEALNENNEWKAIEYFAFSGCGNSYGTIPLDTNSFLMFGVNKYKGNFKTKLRVRLLTNSGIIFSNEYDGKINIEQFVEDTTGFGYGYNKHLNAKGYEE